MKTKAIVLIVVSAVITLSFTFNIKKDSLSKKASTEKPSNSKNEPAGGFSSEDKL